MREVAADAKLSIIVQNPAHKDFIKRPATDPVEETKPLTANQARKLMGFASGDEVLDYRDRAILKFYLFTGARIATGCNLDVADFRFDEDDSTIRIEEKAGANPSAPLESIRRQPKRSTNTLRRLGLCQALCSAPGSIPGVKSLAKNASGSPRCMNSCFATWRNSPAPTKPLSFQTELQSNAASSPRTYYGLPRRRCC